jgi:hypothetical protein
VGAAIGLIIGLTVAGAGAIVVACYDVPRPDCGFVCGPDSACPDGYTCADDHRCHRIGAPADLVCPIVDAPLPVDGLARDAAPDGPGDAPDDAPSDAPDDAPTDASADAPTDAPDDAPP